MVIIVTHNSIPYTVPKYSTPFDLFTSNNLHHPLLVYIDSTLSDLSEPFTNDCTIVDVEFDSAIGKNTFWHSSAHILGYAIMRLFPDAKLASGPPTLNGFYYDVEIERPLTAIDLENIKTEALKIIKENHKYLKSEMTREDLIKYYSTNRFKQFYVERASDGIVYTIGEFVDFCRGPHINQTGLVKVFSVEKSGASHFKADHNSLHMTPLQRVYGISFPSKALFKEYKNKLEIAKTQDHRRIGSEHQLFFFSDLSPGSCFFTPEGTIVYKALVSFIQEEYRKRGFKEVITPNIFSTKLWEQSGHLSNYKENMFIMDVDKEEFALKPMNCPGHCLIFKNSTRSYRDLPLRYADFGVLHRNELSGTLTGLTRVRRFQQDDAHIFCTMDQVEEEIRSCITFLEDVYKLFNFKYELALSTRPEKFIGQIQTWDNAELKLKKALKGRKYIINTGDGAFYGPKIDITLEDVYGRMTQCATIQLDFQLPERFDLSYCDSENMGCRPVIIHRAIFGSIERFFAIIIENYGIKLPFWLSPWQIAIINTKDNGDYAQSIVSRLWKYNVFHFKDSLTLQKQIRLAETKGYRLIIVVGSNEKNNESVNVRGIGEIKIDVFEKVIERMVNERIEYNEAVNFKK